MSLSILLKIASDAIEEGLLSKTIIDKEALVSQYDFLLQTRACFVTLTINGQLRGCIGSLIPHRKLIDDIIENAKKAAFQDPRFKPLTALEFEKTNIEISLLTVPKLLNYESIKDLQSKIRIGIDGVILQYEKKQATFLPQVWEQLPEFTVFFEHLCTKAGLSSDCLKNNPTIYTYQAQKIK